MKKHQLSRNKIIVGLIILLFIMIYFSYALYLRISMREKYSYAMEAYHSGEYETARDRFMEILNYQDSRIYYNDSLQMIANEEDYQKALTYMDAENYDQAISMFENLGDYKDSKEKIAEIKDARYAAAYNQAIQHYEQGHYRMAIVDFEVLGDYKDSYWYLEKCYTGIRYELSKTISAGSMYSVALTEKEGVKFTGDMNYGQDALNDGNYISISAGGYYTIGLYENGTVDVAGDIPWLSGSPNSDWKNVIQVSSGFDFVAVLHDDGTVDIQGQNSKENYNEVLDFSDWKDIAMIDAGYHMVIGLDYEGKVHVTGRNASNIRDEIERNSESWKDVIAIATGGTSKSSQGYVVGLKADGTVITAGKTQDGIKEAENWKDIQKISAGDYHLVGITTDGQMVAVMNNDPNDQRDSKDACCSFDQWPQDAKIVDVSAGNGTTLGLSADGIVYTSGFDLQAQMPESGEWTGVKVYE